MKNLKKKVVVAISVVAFTMAGVFGVINSVQADNPGEVTASKKYNESSDDWCTNPGVNCISTVVVVGSHN